ncbi:MAG: hypothetical protein CW691_10360 [Candidatus Bathyarchaeum sp.]|nr:MAG: hypothetical protein CW691_10360 [Candidatus Bathyarchaeum sp.]
MEKSNQSTINISRITSKLLVALLICSVSIVVICPMNLLAYGAGETSYVYGRVKDVDREPLDDVNVKLISSNGAVIASTTTNTNGLFYMQNVAYGTFTVKFSKEGYAEYTNNIVLQSAQTNLRTTTLSKAVTLSTSILHLISNPGDQIIIPITAKNNGEDTEIVDFSSSAPTGWASRILSDSYEITKISLSSGQSMSLQLEVAVPSTASVDTNYNVTLTTLGLTNSSLTFTVVVQTQSTATVSGIVVDESGNELNDVTISSYSSDVLVSSVETSDGSFNIEVPISTTITLQISKDGYSQVTKTISPTYKGETIELGEVVLANSLTLYSSILNTVANSGEQLRLPFAVSNIGEDIEVAEFSVSVPEGWSTRILNDNGREITKASLSAGSSSNFNLEVNIPFDYTGETNLTLSTGGNAASTLEFTVNVEPLSDSVIYCQFPGKSAVPGDNVMFNVELKNPFNVETRFKISVDSVPANWTVSVKTSSGESVTEIVLGADESVGLVVEVESASSAISDETYEVLIIAGSGDQTVSSLPLTVTLAGDAAAVKISTKFPDVTIEAGESVDYDVTVTNVGDTDRLLYFTIIAPSDWKAVVKSGSLEVSRLDIEAGSSEALVIEVTPPSTVSLDSYDIGVQFTSESGALLGEIDLTATVVGAYSLDMELSTLLTSTTSGSSTSFTATITNTGYSYVTGVSLELDVEDDWDVTISPTQVDRLNPQESCTFEVIVDTPEGTIAGDYMVTVGAVSDQSSSDQTQVRITVTTSGSWALYGIGVAAVLVVALVLVFKKFKRR